MSKCKDCEYFKIQDLPDEMNEGHALCTKHNLIVDLFGHRYQKKIDSLTCIKDDEFEPVKKMTQGDKIRAMSDEELAIVFTCNSCNYKEDCKDEGNYGNVKINSGCLQDYYKNLADLKSEAKESEE